MHSYVHDPSLTIFGKLVILAYPIMDIALVFVVFRSLLFGAAHQTFRKLLAASLIFMFMADFVYDLLVLHNSYQTGDFVDGLFLTTYVLIGVAALHPSMGHPPHPPEKVRPASIGRRPDGRRRIPIVAFAGFIPPSHPVGGQPATT